MLLSFVSVISTFKKLGGTCAPNQFSLILGCTMSIHRSQGITLDTAIIDICDTEFQIRLTFIALSRGKTSDGFLLELSFNSERLLKNQYEFCYGRSSWRTGKTLESSLLTFIYILQILLVLICEQCIFLLNKWYILARFARFCPCPRLVNSIANN